MCAARHPAHGSWRSNLVGPSGHPGRVSIARAIALWSARCEVNVKATGVSLGVSLSLIIGGVYAFRMWGSHPASGVVFYNKKDSRRAERAI